MEKRYTAAGVSTDVHGKRGLRLTNLEPAAAAAGRMRVLGMHTDVVMYDLPHPMTVNEAVDWLRGKGLKLVTRVRVSYHTTYEVVG